MRFYEGDDVGYYEGGWTGEAFLRGVSDGFAPAALVEAVGFDAARGEGGEELVVTIDMIVEAVDED